MWDLDARHPPTCIHHSNRVRQCQKAPECHAAGLQQPSLNQESAQHLTFCKARLLCEAVLIHTLACSPLDISLYAFGSQQCGDNQWRCLHSIDVTAGRNIECTNKERPKADKHIHCFLTSVRLLTPPLTHAMITLYSGPAVNIKSAKNVSSAHPVFLFMNPCRRARQSSEWGDEQRRCRKIKSSHALHWARSEPTSSFLGFTAMLKGGAMGTPMNVVFR